MSEVERLKTDFKDSTPRSTDKRRISTPKRFDNTPTTKKRKTPKTPKSPKSPSKSGKKSSTKKKPSSSKKSTPSG